MSELMTPEDLENIRLYLVDIVEQIGDDVYIPEIYLLRLYTEHQQLQADNARYLKALEKICETKNKHASCVVIASGALRAKERKDAAQ